MSGCVAESSRSVNQEADRQPVYRFTFFWISPPVLLAIDTATQHLALALHDGQQVVLEQFWPARQMHTQTLAPRVAALLALVALTPADLQGVAVAIGPGSYTSLRIGVGLAQGLALANGTPLMGLSTFDIVARAQPYFAGALWVLVAAGRGRVSVAEYAWAADAARWQLTETAPRLRPWAALSAELAATAPPVLVCGEIDAVGRAALPATAQFAPAPANVRRAAWLAELGWERLRATGGDDPHRLAPQYGQPLEGA